MSKISINITSGQLAQNRGVVGIDLGTTNSLIALVDQKTGLPYAIPDESGHVSTPSLVYIDKDGSSVVGKQARQMIEVDPSSVIYSVKRLMGINTNELKSAETDFSYPVVFDPVGNGFAISLGSRLWSPEQISAEILKALKVKAERHLNQKIHKAVITVPAYFNDAQRQATREAGRLAGLDVLRIINEPTAASLAYGIGLDQSVSKKVAVYDLGGGTFDISILEITGGVFEVLSTCGNTHLGGDDFDNCIVDFWKEILNLSDDYIVSHRAELRILAEQAKCILSDQETFEGMLEQHSLHITRSVFDKLIEPLIGSTLQACKQALSDAGCTAEGIDEIVLVGGSTRVPLVITRVSDFFNREVRHSIDPDQVVALGAAIQADILAGNNQESLLLDVTPLSLGIETAGGLMDVLIPRNSKIPSRVERQYSTQKDGQTGIRISVFQGERDMVKDNRELSTFILKGIPVMPAGFPKVMVAFQIDADGILQVRAKELRTGIEQAVRIDNKLELDDILVEKMITDSLVHASADVTERKWAELKVEAEQLIDSTDTLIRSYTNYLSGSDLRSIEEAVHIVKQQLANRNIEMLKMCMQALNDSVRPLAERIMNETMKKTLEDQNRN